MPLSSTPPEDSYLSWAKKRALALAEKGQLKKAIFSMVFDLRKDPDSTQDISFVTGMACALKDDPALNKQMVVDWINGF